MAFVPFTATAQASVRHLWLGQEVENNLYFSWEGAAGGMDVANLAGNLLIYWTDNMMPLQSNTTQLLGVYVRSLVDEIAEIAFASPAGTINGGVSGDSCPSNASVAVSFRSGFSGRSSRGRNYWIGLPEGLVSGNVIADSLLNNIRTAYDGMIGDSAITPDARWVIASRQSGGVDRVVGVTYDVASVTYSNNTVDSMRRRLPGRGR